MDFSNEQEERYARNIIMKEIGHPGQAKLLVKGHPNGGLSTRENHKGVFPTQ